MTTAKKSLEVYQLNKEFTQVMSPIDGQVSRYYLTLGNLVNQDQTLLTTVVSLDPMYVYFDMDESTLLQIRKAISEGRITVPADGDLPVGWGCKTRTASRTKRRSLHQQPGELHDGKHHRCEACSGTRNSLPRPRLPACGTKGNALLNPTLSRRRGEPFAPSALQPAAGGSRGPSAPSAEKVPVPGVTSTIQFDRLFSPGMFVRVRLPIGEPHEALLVIDRAIQSDQGLKYVYVLDGQNKVQTRSIKTGSLQEDGLRVVEGEIKEDDWVVVGAIQQVRPHMEVKPDRKADAVAGRPSRGAAAGQWSKGNEHRPECQVDPFCRKGLMCDELVKAPAFSSDAERNSRFRQEGPALKPSGATMISRFFIDRPIFATVLSVVITLIGGISLLYPAGRPVPADHAARREHLDQLSRRQRPGRGRHGRRAHRATGQRRRGHALHVVATRATTARTP